MPSTAVTTRFALMIVWDRNSGINRADTKLPANPTRSRAMPAMKAGVRAAATVDFSDGP
ncbi:Uncharacterised protein [Mycobacteroides abscessus]|nr:Uncharacterised protein [Mycobacteroides abscessus]SIA36408.1 Uncharacterised protein [Mycobacteroides abscessus subsp. abscessus]SIC54657.1 Uncharacterised protein [Mycobacteroides abscessus subsp. abscessus]